MKYIKGKKKSTIKTVCSSKQSFVSIEKPIFIFNWVFILSLSFYLVFGHRERLSYFHIYPTPPLGQDMTQGQFFKRSLTGLNSEFSFS